MMGSLVLGRRAVFPGLADAAKLGLLLLLASCQTPQRLRDKVNDPLKYPTARMRTARSAQLKVLTVNLSNKQGHVTPLTLTVAPNERGVLDVNVSESMAAGTGVSLRAALWKAAFGAASLVGRQLIEYSITLRCTEAIDGSSIGALLTSALMAAMVGLETKSDVSMTGSLLPDGTIGPVAGIPQKLEAAIRAGIKTVGYPVGMRQARDLRSGQAVDLERIAADKGAKAVELATVHDAFRLLTGQDFGKPPPIDPSKLTLPPQLQQQVQAAATAAIASAEKLLEGATDDLPEPQKQQRELARKQLSQARQKLSQQRVATALTAAQQARMAAYSARLALEHQAFIAKPDEQQTVARLVALQELLKQVRAEAKQRRYSYQHSFFQSHWNIVSYQRLIAAFYFTIGAARQASVGIAMMRVLQGKPPVPEGSGPSGVQNQAEKKALKDALAKLDKKEIAQRLPDLARGVLLFEALGWSQLQIARDYGRLDTKGPETAKNQTPELDERLLSDISQMYIQASRANLVYYQSILQQTARSLSKTELTLHTQLAALAAGAWAIPDQVVAPRWGANAASTAMVRLAGAKESFLDAAFLVYRAFYPTLANKRAQQSMLVRGDAIVRRLSLFAANLTGGVPMSARFFYQVARDAQSDGDTVTAVEMYWRAALEAHFSVLLGRVLKGSLPDRPEKQRPDQPLRQSPLEHFY